MVFALFETKSRLAWSLSVFVVSQSLVACGGELVEPPSAEQATSEQRVSVEGARVCAAWSRISQQSMPTSVRSPVRCGAGVTHASTMGVSLEAINFFRGLARLPALPEAVSQRAATQGCADLMEANGRIDHAPTATWQCYSPQAASTAAQSLLVGSVGYPMTPVRAAWNWITEARDLSANLGHRRWLLSRSLRSIAYAQSTSFACLSLADMGTPSRTASWAAWPPPGHVPHDLVPVVWSVSTTGYGVSAATRVRLWIDGVERAVATRREPATADDETVSFVPPSLDAGHRYRVRVEGLAGGAIDYDVVSELCPGG